MIMNTRHPSLCFLLLIILFSFLLQSPPSSAVDFIFNSFHSTSISRYGNTVNQLESLTLTSSYPYQVGRALYPHKIPVKKASSLLPFSTSFIFTMVPTRNLLPGHGFVFLFTPITGIQETSGAEYLGLFSRMLDGNSSNHVFGIEFDVFRNEEFGDINDNHVGIDVNSVRSVISHAAGYYPEGSRNFVTLQLNDGRNYQVWIRYTNFTVDVTMAPVGEKPGGCFICGAPLNLSDVFEDEMYVGFTAATGTLTQRHTILGWSFSNSDDPLWSDGLITQGLPLFVLPGGERNKQSTGFIVGLPLGIFFVLVTCGVFTIKKSFLAEVQSIGSIHHVNLVRLRGFCIWKSQRFLVYDFMSNGSLDKWIYHGNREHILDWKCRQKIILDIAKGLAYLHEECRQKIIHLDIKPQNILLDDDFNAKVSDFGLSKLMDRNQTQVMTTMRGTPWVSHSRMVELGYHRKGGCLQLRNRSLRDLVWQKEF